MHSTVLTVPANSLVKVTIYQYDTATGLRNPYWGGPRGIVGEMSIDGKPTPTLDPDLASHTFAIPDLGVSVPLKGVADDAKNQCSVAPCTLAEAHNTITFTFRTGKPAPTAGSASCPARPGSSSASAGRCRASATWTATCTSSRDRRPAGTGAESRAARAPHPRALDRV